MLIESVTEMVSVSLFQDQNMPEKRLATSTAEQIRSEPHKTIADAAQKAPISQKGRKKGRRG